MARRDRARDVSLFCAAAVIVVCVSCAKSEPPRLYTLNGTVVKLDRETNVATIKGDKITGWMDAMTMEYPVQDRNEYRALHAGEKVTATVNVSSEGYWLTNVKESKGD